MSMAADLAKYLGAELEGDASVIVTGVSGPGPAGERDLIYLDTPKHLKSIEASRAKCVLVRSGIRVKGKTNLSVEDPKFAFAKAASWLAPTRKIARGVHRTAVVASTAKVDPTAHIGPYVVIEDGAQIGLSAEIGAFCYIGEGAVIGANCRLH